MDNVFENPPDMDMWTQAFEAKFEGKGKPFNKDDWDKLLGHCQVWTLQSFLTPYGVCS